MKINEFQKSTEVALRTLLDRNTIPARFELGGGPREFGVKVTFADYVSWLYPDGADVIGRDIDKRFEIYDYDSVGDLQCAYIKFMDELIRERKL